MRTNPCRAVWVLLALGLCACGDDTVAGAPDAGPDSAAIVADAPRPVGGDADATAIAPDAAAALPCDEVQSVVFDDKDPRVVQADAILQDKYGGSRPGVAALIVLDGVVVLKKGYGLADIASGRPITPCSTFDLASVSKHFTAAAVLLLAQDGKLTLEDDVRDHLPELPVFDADNPIRIRHLLHHTSGLPDYLDLTWQLSDAAFAAMVKDDVLQLVAKQKLDFATGSAWAYSNTNYVLAALLVERVAQQSFSGFMDQRFFDLLGMTDTLVFGETTGSVPGRVTGYSTENGQPAISQLDGAINGDGNVFTSVHDLVRWEAEWRTPTLLTADSVSQAYLSGTAGGAETDYGLGWSIDTVDSQLVVWHSGGWYGTSTYVERWVDDDLSIWLLSNDDWRDPYTEAAASIVPLFH